VRNPTDPEQTRVKTPHEVSRVDTLPDGFLEKLRSPLPKIGEVIGGRYKLLRMLGRGAMGHVFVAENLAINKQVAVKVLSPLLLADSEFRARFQQEAESVAAIDHPNVARFFDLVVGDPTFLVMEYVPGETLSQILKSVGSLAVERALAITERLCWALDAAHASGVVHRDLKPANIIVAIDREHGEAPKLIDWGLAKRPAADTLTRTGQIIGTPAYMSPEQVSGSIDARSDVYALGCVLYEMLCGRPPFEKTSDDMRLLYQHVHDQPDPPSKHKPLPPEIDALLGRTLQKDPARRFQTMAEMARAVAACRTSAAPVATAPVRGGLPTWALSAFIVAGVLVGAGVARLTVPKHRAVAGSAQIVVLSMPSGATVEVDGKALPDTTPAVALDLAPGEHVVKASHAGLDTVEQHVRLAPGERIAIQLALPQRSRTVALSTSPSGAHVYVDGKISLGETPVALQLSADEFHEIRMEKLGYESMVEHLAPDDKRTRFDADLAPEHEPRGEVWIDSVTSAEVWIDNGPTAFVTPTLALRLPVGAHTIELRDADGSARKDVTVHQGESLHVLLDIKKGSK
jgi:tRNA A-37 threonylcarbamoyl transferase component Bud32